MSDSPEKLKVKVGIRGGPTKSIEVEVKAGQPIPWDLDTKFAVVGTKPARLDAVAKATGRAKYTYDINLPGMVYGKFVRAPYAAAKVLSIDVEAAKKIPGVVYAMEWGSKNVKFPWAAVAVVAAETKQALEAGVRAVKVEYEVLPHAARLDQALAEGAPIVNANQKSNKNGQGFEADKKAEVDAAFAKAAKVVSGTARTQVQTHSALETKGVVVQFLDDGKAKVWASTQGTFSVRGDFARTFKMKESDVQVITHYMGGGFGAKFGLGQFGHAAGQIAKELNRPCKFMLDRKEEHMTGGNRPDSVQEMSLAVGQDGKLGGYRVDKYGTGGVGGGGSGARNPLIYDVGPVAEADYGVSTNAGPAAAFRAPGHPQGSFAMEAILDMAAEAIGMDPLELRKKNDDHPIRQHQYTEGAKLFGWSKRKKNGADTGPVKRGIGVASAVWFQLGGRGATCLCRIRKDGSVEIRNGAQDIGTGTRTIMAMTAAEELGLPLDGVTAFLGDTNDPVGPASGGSVTAPTIMPAARTAAFSAGAELRKLVATKLGGDAEDYVLKGGKIVAKSGGKSLGWIDACKLIEADAIEVLGTRERNHANFEGNTGGVHFAEVEVDTETGKVRVLRFLAMQDAGTIINAGTAESQVNGAVIQGLSYALFEERVLDRHKGQQLNADLESYKIAGPKDMPDIKVVLTDVNMGANNVGLAGLGEGPAVAPAAAIANAVHNALGVRVWQIPMTPDKVLAALANAKQGGGK